MRGMDGATAELVAATRVRLPAKLEELEDRLDLRDGALPRPGYIDHGQRSRLEEQQWPAVLAIPNLSGTPRQVERGDVVDTLVRPHTVRLYVYVRASGVRTEDTDLPVDGHELVESLRKRYMLALEETMLEAPTLDDDGLAVVNIGSLRTSYSDVMADDVGRSIGAAYLEVTVDLEEHVAHAPLNPASSSVDVDAVPLHPALADA